MMHGLAASPAASLPPQPTPPRPAVPQPGKREARRQWLHDLPSRSALRAFNHPWLRPWLGRRHARALDQYRTRLPSLSEADARIVAAIERDGVYITTLDALQIADSATIMRAGAALADAFAPQARDRAAAGEPFLYVPPAWLFDCPTLFEWGLDQRLLDIAESYIGLPAAYDGVCLNYTVADGREVSTRKWHRDWEDRRMLKVAVYLDDVDGEGGPFQIIRRRDSGQDDRNGFDYELADTAELERRLGPDFADDVCSCEGPAGTVIFTDTARFFHRGKPATARDRAALFYSYFARRPRHPFLCERSGMPRADIARLARNLPDRQRQAALWRRGLPLPLRMIPSARL